MRQNLGRFSKKLLAVALCVSLSAGALAGCSKKESAGNNSTEDSRSDSESQSTDAQQETTTQFPDIERKTADEIKINPEVIDVTTFALPDGPEESGIFVQPIEDISDDFIRGMDASAVLGCVQDACGSRS